MGINKFKSIDDGSLWEILMAISEETGIGIEKIVEEAIGINEGLKIILEAIPNGAPEIVRRNVLKREISDFEKSVNRPYKLSIVLELYKKLKDTKYPIKNDLKRLFLDGANYSFTVQPNKKGGFNYEIITKDKQQKLDDLIFKPELKVFLEEVFDQVVNTIDLTYIMKDNYDEAAIIDKALLELATEKKIIDTTDSFDENKNNMEVLAKIKMQLYKKIDEDDEFLREGDKRVSSYIKENMQFVDINKFLLLTATRLIVGVKVASGEKIEGITLCDHEKGETAKNTKLFIENVRSELKERAKKNSKVKELSQSLYTPEGEELINVDLKYIDTFLKRFIEDRYITDAEIESVHKELVENGQMPLCSEMCEIAGISIEDLKNIGKNMENEKEPEKKEALLKGSEELIKYLKETQGLSDEKMMEMYIEGGLGLEFIKSIDFENLDQEFYINKFKETYINTLGDKQKEEKVKEIEKLKRYSKLCDVYIKNNKINREEFLLSLMEDSDVKDLYNLRIISLYDLAQCYPKRKEFIEEFKTTFNFNNLTAEDGLSIKKLIKEGFIREIDIAGLIKNIEDDKLKHLCIMHLFPEIIEDKEIRDKITNIVFNNIVDTPRQKENKTKNDENGGSTRSNSKKYVKDVMVRNNIINQYDSKATINMITGDGYEIIEVADKIVFEKVFDKNGNFGYGAATYVLSKKLFDQNFEEILQCQRINGENKYTLNFKKLKELNANGESDRGIHNKAWALFIKEAITGIKSSAFTEKETILQEQYLKTCNVIEKTY